MPIYEYLCDACGETIEKIQRQPLEQVSCTHCNQKAKRIISLSAAPRIISGDSCAPGGSGFG